VHYVHHHYYHDRDYDYDHDRDYHYSGPVYRTDQVITTGHVYHESEPEEFGVVNQYDRQSR
jgi:hypothetical protein